MKNLNIYLIISMILLLNGCNQLKDDSKITNKQNAEDITALEDRIGKLEGELFWTKLTLEKFTKGVFDPLDGKGFQRVESSNGTFLITLQDVTPYLSGVKVKLEIGNILNASYTGFKLKVKYGKRYPVYVPNEKIEVRKTKREEYESSIKEKEESFTQILKPATWNSVYIVLPNINPVDFGELTIEMETSLVTLKSY